MRKWFDGTVGFLLGSIFGTGLTFTCAVVLWATREVWFEVPDGDSLQYFDLMVWLCLLTPLVLLPVTLIGGFVGARLATTEATSCGETAPNKITEQQPRTPGASAT